MRYAIRYFSGTGNTERAVGIIAEALKAHGAEVDARSIEEGPPAASLDGAEGLVLAFPTYAFMPPAFVARFMSSLPRGAGMPAYVLACDGGGGYTAPGAAARALRCRGYDVRLALCVSYTENWTQFFKPPPEAEQQRLTAQGDARARDFASKLISGEKIVQAPGSGGLFLGLIGALFRLVGRRFLGKVYIADSDCTACGLCARICPVGCIVMRGKGAAARPAWRINCEDCNRCINLCPERAINVSVARVVLLAALAIGASAACIAAWASVKHSLGFSGVLYVVVDSLAFATAVFLGHAIALGPLDFLLTRAQRVPFLARFFSKSHTKATRRYRAPGFKARPMRA